MSGLRFCMWLGEEKGWVELYQQTGKDREGRERERKTTAAVHSNLPGTRHKRGVLEGGGRCGRKGKNGKKGSGRTSGCPRSAHIIDMATEGAGEGARCNSIRCVSSRLAST